MNQLCTDWPNVESDMGSWRDWMDGGHDERLEAKKDLRTWRRLSTAISVVLIVAAIVLMFFALPRIAKGADLSIKKHSKVQIHKTKGPSAVGVDQLK
jgi:hypothetical protein